MSRLLFRQNGLHNCRYHRTCGIQSWKNMVLQNVLKLRQFQKGGPARMCVCVCVCVCVRVCVSVCVYVCVCVCVCV